MKTLLVVLLSLLVFFGAGGALLLLTPLGQGPLTALFRVGTIDPVDFATLQLTENPNQFLMCPPDMCSAQPHAQSPEYPMPVAELRARWQEMVGQQPRVTVLAEGPDGDQVDYVQRSARFRFPDIITVRFIALSENRSTLAVYSRSLFGKSDLGVNRERIAAWTAQLDAS